MTTDTKPRAVLAAIVSVATAMSQQGIGKEHRNTDQKYNFRGIDDVLNALSPLYAQHSLFIVPRVTERTVIEGKTAKGNTLWKVTVKVDYHVTSAIDGSEVVCSTYGEAMDSADKATNKALSAAYKYLVIQLFAIPVVGTGDDADAHSPEMSADRQQGRQQSRPARKPASPHDTIRNLLSQRGTEVADFLAEASDKIGITLQSVEDIPDDWASWYAEELVAK